MNDFISDRANGIDASGIRKVFALAEKMKDPVNFSIGQPDFDVPEELKQAAIEAIRSGANKYSQTAGDSALLEKIGKKIQQEFGWENPASMVTSGVSGGLQLLFMAVINPGDEVIIPDPYFVIYKHVINMLGGKCVFVDSYPDFQLPIEKIKNAINPKTKMIIVNSPANPTGAVYTEKNLQQLASITAGKDILILSDEIYNKFYYGKGGCPSICKYSQNTILLRGFGKSYAMTGWRIGYASAPAGIKNGN